MSPSAFRGAATHSEAYDTTPFRSGKKLTDLSAGGHCTTAFVVNGGLNLAQRYVLTAGHCGWNGSRHQLGNSEVSRMENNTIWGLSQTDADAAVIYANHSASNPSVWVTPSSGGASFARPVVAQSGPVYGGDPLVPYAWVCFSGATTHNTDSCGYVSATNVTLTVWTDHSNTQTRVLTDQFSVEWWWGPGVRFGDSGGGVYGLNPDGSAIALGILSACAGNATGSDCANQGTASFAKISTALARTNTRLAATGRRPFGSFDGISSGAGSVNVSGWAMDPDLARSASQVHVYVGGPAGSGAPGYALTADTYRPDVGAAYPNTGNSHGLYGTLPAPRGTNDPVYVYAIDLGEVYSGNAYLGARSVYVP